MTRRERPRTLVLGPLDPTPWQEIDLGGKDDPVRHFHVLVVRAEQEDPRPDHRACPIKQDLFEDEEPHEIVLKQAQGSRISLRCLGGHGARDVIGEVVEQLRER